MAKSTWKPGQSGNPAGRPPGSGEVGKLRAGIAGHVPAILDRLVAAAQDGDVQAARLLLERCLPALKPTELPQAIELPDGGSLTETGRAVLNAVGNGSLPAGEGAKLMAAIAALGRVAELDELAARIEALEGKHHAKP
jgi:hypothetical protein